MLICIPNIDTPQTKSCYRTLILFHVYYLVTRKTKAGGASKKEEEIETTLPAEEKQNGAENIA